MCKDLGSGHFLRWDKAEQTENQWLFLDWSECEDAEQKAEWTAYKNCSRFGKQYGCFPQG